MNSTEKIVEKIKKVLELSKNNPSAEEAASAALKAQRLMAEYHISMEDIDISDNVDDIVEQKCCVGKGNKWKYLLAQIVSKNFRCMHFITDNKMSIVFYGHEADAKIAAETYKFLYDTGNKAANNYYMKMRNNAKRNHMYFDGSGIKNAFLIGYMDGIRDGLDKQCTALMIIVPQDVTDGFNKRVAGFRTVNNNIHARSMYANQSRDDGYITGKNTINGRCIATT